VFRYATAPPPARAGWKLKATAVDFTITDRAGAKLGTHRIVKLRRASQVRIEDLIARSTGEAAAHLGLSRKDLVLRRATARSRGREPHVF
jgi:hypothetical protein